ncbi:hypothetical protein DFP94_10761 [Fontibacillus phaseoli]|uniref:Uncharacterized protein n=1 Tax=Fontibacillus phaseoli TaxID=1416533 RepID=A0A369BCC4_9BACL|nr:hypothetical protein DFP94_10761 [Fontibacillus phaseoli]
MLPGSVILFVVNNKVHMEYERDDEDNLEKKMTASSRDGKWYPKKREPGLMPDSLFPLRQHIMGDQDRPHSSGGFSS